jgi:hypothetical protein
MTDDIKKQKSFRVFVIYALLLQFAVLMSQTTKINNLNSSTVKNYSARDATVQVLISYVNTYDTLSSPDIAYTGTGTIISDSNESIYVLTVKHVCSPENNSIAEANGYASVIEIQDIDGSFNVAEVIQLSDTDDLCVLKYHPAGVGTYAVASISSVPPIIDDMMYMYAAPSGFYVPSAITQFSGTYSGNVMLNMGVVGVYTIPATGGSSGSSIVNSSGEIVGVLHSTLASFHHVSLASTYSSLIKFIEDLEDKERIIILD